MVPFLAVLYFGGYVLMAGCIFIGLAGVYEFFRGFRSMGIKPCYPIAVVSTVILYAYASVVLYLHDGPLIIAGRQSWSSGGADPSAPAFLASSGAGIMEWFGPIIIWIFFVIVVSLLYLFKIDERKLEDAMATMTGIFYVVFFSFHVMLVDMSGDTAILVWLIILSAFATDIMAYFTGRAFGKHKLCPKISPKKTIEGSIGGIIGSVIICGIFGAIFAGPYLIHCIIIGALGGVISQFGDLTASIFKRKMGIKDYGDFIPGHGGILDRFDSVLFTAPLVFYYIVIVIQ